jgi:hypothetical protein
MNSLNFIKNFPFNYIYFAGGVSFAGTTPYIEIQGIKINYKGNPAIMVVGLDVTARRNYQKIHGLS